MAERENKPLSTGSANFNFYLNRQGAQGKKGERGEEGFSPYITQGKDTLNEYTMIVTNKNGSFETPNLREHKEDRGGTYYRYDRTTGVGYIGDANQATPELKGEIRIATQEDFDRLSGDTAVTPETLSSINPLKLGYIDDRDESQTGSVAYVEYKTEITGNANHKTVSFESSFVSELWENGIRDDVTKYYLLGQNSLKSTDGSITITRKGKTLDLSANPQGYVLPAATATTLGGIKAETKTDAETNEVKIDPATNKLYVAGGGSAQDVEELGNELNQLANDVTNIESQIGSINTEISEKQSTLTFHSPLDINISGYNPSFLIDNKDGTFSSSLIATSSRSLIECQGTGVVANHIIIPCTDTTYKIVDWSKLPYYQTDNWVGKTFKFGGDNPSVRYMHFCKKASTFLPRLSAIDEANTSRGVFAEYNGNIAPSSRSTIEGFNTTVGYWKYSGNNLPRAISGTNYSANGTYLEIRFEDENDSQYRIYFRDTKGGTESSFLFDKSKMADVDTIVFSQRQSGMILEDCGVFDSSTGKRLWSPLQTYNYSNDVALNYGTGLAVQDNALISYPKNFMLKFGRTDLNQTISSPKQFSLASLLQITDNQAFANVVPPKYDLQDGTLKLPFPSAVNSNNTNTLINYSIDVRITGTIGGSANTPRDFTIELQRPSGEKIESHSVVKVATNNLDSQGVVFSTYTLGSSDPLILDGLNFVLNNTSGQTITLTGVTILIKGQGG